MVSGRTHKFPRKKNKTVNLEIWTSDFFLNWYKFVKFPVSNNSQSNKLVLFKKWRLIELVKPCSRFRVISDRRHRLPPVEKSDIAALTPWFRGEKLCAWSFCKTASGLMEFRLVEFFLLSNLTNIFQMG